MIENRQFGPVDATRWFRVPPHKVGILDRATFSNIEQQEIQSVIDCLLPWAVCLEQELNIKLLGRTSRGNNFFKHNFNARLRGDAAARSGFYEIMLDRGVLSINDVLDKEDMNPIGPDGDQRFVQENLIPLNLVAKKVEAEMKNANEPPPAPNPNPAPDPSTLTPIFTDAMTRILRREQNTRDRHKEKPFDEWADDIANGQDKYIRDALTPAIQSLASLACAKQIETITQVALKTFAQHYQQGLTERCKNPEQLKDETQSYVAFAVKSVLALAEIHG